MMGNLFAGCEESPGTTELFQGRKYKVYRGMESSAFDDPEPSAIENGSDHPSPTGVIISRGVEGRITYKGHLFDVLQQLLGGLAVGMSYAGCKTLEDMHNNTRFVRVTTAGLQESHPHDIQITRESPNYNMI